MFRAFFALSTAFALAACSNSSSSSGGAGNGCPPGQKPALTAQIYHAQVAIPGVPPANPPQNNPGQPAEPAKPVNCVPDDNVGQNTGVMGTWVTDELSDDLNTYRTQLSVNINKTQMTVTRSCTDMTAQKMGHATLTVPISVNGESVNIIQGGQKVEQVGNIQCGVEVVTGPVNSSRQGDTLNVVIGGQNVAFKRLQTQKPDPTPGPTPNQGVMGAWKAPTERFEGGTAQVVLTIGRNTVSVAATCRLNDGRQATAQVTVPAEVTDTAITIARGAEDTKVVGNIQCSASLPAGNFTYTLNGNQLTIAGTTFTR